VGDTCSKHSCSLAIILPCINAAITTLIDVRLLQWGAPPAGFCEHGNELGATKVASQEITTTLVILRVVESWWLRAEHV
jgi:hypothetical protein